jgi:hypothetical protein
MNSSPVSKRLFLHPQTTANKLKIKNKTMMKPEKKRYAQKVLASKSSAEEQFEEYGCLVPGHGRLGSSYFVTHKNVVPMRLSVENAKEAYMADKKSLCGIIPKVPEDYTVFMTYVVWINDRPVLVKEPVVLFVDRHCVQALAYRLFDQVGYARLMARPFKPGKKIDLSQDIDLPAMLENCSDTILIKELEIGNAAEIFSAYPELKQRYHYPDGEEPETYSVVITYCFVGNEENEYASLLPELLNKYPVIAENVDYLALNGLS